MILVTIFCIIFLDINPRSVFVDIKNTKESKLSV